MLNGASGVESLILKQRKDMIHKYGHIDPWHGLEIESTDV